jgi:hypothetical protein
MPADWALGGGRGKGIQKLGELTKAQQRMMKMWRNESTVWIE